MSGHGRPLLVIFIFHQIFWRNKEQHSMLLNGAFYSAEQIMHGWDIVYISNLFYNLKPSHKLACKWVVMNIEKHYNLRYMFNSLNIMYIQFLKQILTDYPTDFYTSKRLKDLLNYELWNEDDLNKLYPKVKLRDRFIHNIEFTRANYSQFTRVN